MIASMELQRPRVTPALPQWDLGVVLEALNKPPYEPLWEASFKHLTLKTVLLLAMASAGRRSELHALRFDQNYIQFKPKGAGSRKGLQRALTNTMLFSDYHLAKLNPKCYMNYSIIFTEISFSPETSNLFVFQSTLDTI